MLWTRTSRRKQKLHSDLITDEDAKDLRPENKHCATKCKIAARKPLNWLYTCTTQNDKPQSRPCDSDLQAPTKPSCQRAITRNTSFTNRYCSPSAAFHYGATSGNDYSIHIGCWTTKDAEIIVDRWGVPHIYAKSEADVFLAQGFNAARDRLFQIDLWRRRGLGQLSEVFGSAYLEQDRAARLFLYRGDMKKEWAAYGPHAEQLTKQFVAGINAYIGCPWQQHPEKLPPEFKALQYQPAPMAKPKMWCGFVAMVSLAISLPKSIAQS